MPSAPTSSGAKKREKGTPGGIRTPDFQIRSLKAPEHRIRRNRLSHKAVAAERPKKRVGVLVLCLANLPFKTQTLPPWSHPGRSYRSMCERPSRPCSVQLARVQMPKTRLHARSCGAGVPLRLSRKRLLGRHKSHRARTYDSASAILSRLVSSRAAMRCSGMRRGVPGLGRSGTRRCRASMSKLFH